jgi:microcompartment protein CcmL/EutN
MIHAIGLVELTSIAKGIEAADIMAKTANITVLVAKAICPGKYMVLISGDVSAVEQSVQEGAELGAEMVVDQFIIPNVHSSILPAIGGGNDVTAVKAIGIIETYSVASSIEAADAAVKAGEVEPIRLHVAFGIGGKSYSVVTGEVAAVKAAVAAGSEVAAERGLLVQTVVIPRPHKQVIDSLL